MAIEPVQSNSFEHSPWFLTFSGRRFYPYQPRAEDVSIEDIAHALSHLCRFAGHCREFYSVAQHSVWVSLHCRPEDALHGLLHDAQEAYCGDLISPIKRHSQMLPYRDLERGIESAVAERFGLAHTMPESVRAADQQALEYEMSSLFATEQRVESLYPPDAKRHFLRLFDRLAPMEVKL